MSSKALDWAFRQSLKPVTKAILVAMADTAGDDGYLFPSYDYLIYKTDVSQRTLVAAVKELTELGLIVCEKNYREGYRLSNMFFLMLDNKEQMKPAWEGRVSTKARKAQLEEARARAQTRNLNHGLGPAQKTAEARKAGSAGFALTVPEGAGEAGKGANTPAMPLEAGSAGVAPTPNGADVSGSAGFALTVPEGAVEAGTGVLAPVVPREAGRAGFAPTLRDGPLEGAVDGGDFPATVVVQDVHVGKAYVQKRQSLCANPALTPYIEPHDDLSHHQSACVPEPEPASRTGSGDGLIDDDSPIHQGIILTVLADRLRPVLGQVPPARLRVVIDEALSKAKRVSNPLAFVAKCVENDPGRFAPVEGRVPVVRSGGGGGLVSGEEACSKPDHGSYSAANCPACRVGRLVVDSPDAGPVMSADELAAWRAERANKSRGVAVRFRGGLVGRSAPFSNPVGGA